MPIDRHWDWNAIDIDYDGELLRSEKIALIVGENPSVQGAMMISADPVNSAQAPGSPALFVELLFTAPRNRPSLRADGAEFLKGVGSVMVTWAALFSRQKGCEGRLQLDGSPDSVGWYQKRGLQIVDLKPYPL